MAVVLLAWLLTAPVRGQQVSSDASQSDQDPTPTSRLFGVLPNGSTVEPGARYGPITTHETFRFATDDSFDKAVYPFVGVVALLGVGQPTEPYWTRYARAFADNTIGNYLVTALIPMAFHEDPRYFVLGEGAIWRRVGYAASRAVVTRARDGGATLNVGELGGSLLTATLSDFYYPASERGPRQALARAGSQMMWDALSFEAKELWPDLRRTLQHVFHR